MEPSTSQYIQVKNSSIHATGIFAAKDISKGTLIIEYIGEKITKKESARRADLQYEIHENNPTEDGSVYLFELNKNYDIDGNVEYNTARFINHSCSPNCETDIVEGRIWIKAIKNIKQGDELSYDYGYGMDDYENHPCLCGAKNCIGYIVGQQHRKKLLKKLKRKKRKNQ